eukprot:3882387-Pyramimonas_sp.AAC.1
MLVSPLQARKQVTPLLQNSHSGRDPGVMVGALESTTQNRGSTAPLLFSPPCPPWPLWLLRPGSDLPLGPPGPKEPGRSTQSVLTSYNDGPSSQLV